MSALVDRIKWHFQNSYYKIVQILHKLQGSYTPIDSIIVCGSPRSGTTWLTETLSNLPYTTHIDEPLKPNSSRYVGTKIKLGWYPSLPPQGKPSIQQQFFFRDLLSGAFFNPNHIFNAGKFPVYKTKIWLHKFVRINFLLPWLVDAFKLRKPIYILRNPYAVVASQLTHPGWKNIPWENGIVNGSVYPDAVAMYKSCISEIKSREAFLITLWCLENKFLLEHPYHQQNKWHFTTYESLVTNPEKSFQALASDLDLIIPQVVLDAVSKPSQSVVGKRLENDPVKQLSKWRKQLSEEQISIITKVLTDFGITIYTFDSDMPHLPMLN